MVEPIRAITLDLDDTLWPIEPVIEAAEQKLYDWLAMNCPRIARSHTLDTLRRARALAAEFDQSIAHDLTEVRRRSLERIIVEEGAYSPDFVDRAMAEFLEYRNRVDLFADAIPFLQRAGSFLPLLSISNGNADLRRIGLDDLFVAHVSAGEVGAAKPDQKVFRAACERLNLPPRQILHIGDHPVQDILGAAQVGMQTAWINRTGARWCEQHDPDYEITSLDQLLDLVPLKKPGEPE